MDKLRILHLEDNAGDTFFVRNALEESGFDVNISRVTTRAEFEAALAADEIDIILSDHGLPGFSGSGALALARQRCPQIPFIFVSGSADDRQVAAGLAAGATDYVLKDQLWQLVIAIRRNHNVAERKASAIQMVRYNHSMMKLVGAIQQLSLARDLDTIMDIVRTAARELTGADGAAFVLRDGDQCYYAKEDAISPLWKGQRFPMTSCISGWAMLNQREAVIEDIYGDPRIPADAYRPTFVKSLVMVPIRTRAPIGAIGNYWAHQHLATPSEVELLQTLANTTAVAMENVQLYAELEQRVRDRTLQLELANKEMEAFSYSVSHDLRAPLRVVSGYAHLLQKRLPDLDEDARTCLDGIQSESRKMAGLIEDLLRLAKFIRTPLKYGPVNLSAMADELANTLRADTPERGAEFRIQPGLEAQGDAGLLNVVLENLLSNAWKYSSKREQAVIEFGSQAQPDSETAYFVRDNGAGFDMQHAGKLFAPFQRLHLESEFPGTGVGLATAQRIIRRHGGRLWAEAAPDQGATFFFTLPAAPPLSDD